MRWSSTSPTSYWSWVTTSRLSVVNDVSGAELGFDSDSNAVTFITADATIDIPEMPKRDVADRILDQLVSLRTAIPVRP